MGWVYETESEQETNIIMEVSGLTPAALQSKAVLKVKNLVWPLNILVWCNAVEDSSLSSVSHDLCYVLLYEISIMYVVSIYSWNLYAQSYIWHHIRL